MFLRYLVQLCIYSSGIFAAEETPHTRKYFYVGGSYVLDSTNNHILTNQMYVEELKPIGGGTKPFPLVFIHGIGQTGTNWLNKPDGDPGWASYFLSHGYEVYLLDIPTRGRSTFAQSQIQNGTSPITLSAETIYQRFTAPEKYNAYPGAELHTQWPGNGTKGDPIFDAYFASLAASVTEPIFQQSTEQAGGVALLERIGKKVILFGHSQGGTAPWLIADAKPELVERIVALEPAGPPFKEPKINGGVPARKWGLADIPVTYSPPVINPDVEIIKKVLPPKPGGEGECVVQADDPPPRQLENLKKIKVVVVTAEASWHPDYDWCTVVFLQQAGVNSTLLSLSEVGIRGNGHMFFLEKNSDAIADVMRGWLES